MSLGENSLVAAYQGKGQLKSRPSGIRVVTSTFTEMLRLHSELYRAQTDISARLERLEGASPDLNPVELRTNPSDGNLVFHAVPPQVTAPLATRPSITSGIDKETETSFRPLTSVSHSLLELNPPPVLRRTERIRNRIMMGGIQEEVSEVISHFGRPSRAAEGPQLPRSDCRLSVPRKTGKTSETVTFSPVAQLREPGSKPKSPTKNLSFLRYSITNTRTGASIPKSMLHIAYPIYFCFFCLIFIFSSPIFTMIHLCIMLITLTGRPCMAKIFHISRFRYTSFRFNCYKI